MLDKLIVGARVIDGSADPKKISSVGIKDGKILVDPATKEAKEVIDATGKVLCPGFIDAHSHGDRMIATEDGTAGTKGTVLDAVREAGIRPDAVCACGPMPMLKGIAALAKANNVPLCEVSLEERMACGVGACLGCACKVKRNDEEYFLHVCKNGPVFNAEEVVW